MNLCLYSCLSYQIASFLGRFILFTMAFYCTFSHNLIKSNIFRKKIIEHYFFSTKLAWNISHYTNTFSELLSQIHTGLHVQYLLFLVDFNQISIFSAHFSKILNIKFHKKKLSLGAKLALCFLPQCCYSFIHPSDMENMIKTK